MEEKRTKMIALVAVCTAISVAILIITVSFVAKDRTEDPEPWVLHSYGNNVALYNGDKIVEVYGTIMLDTLPEDDKRQLDSGIAFQTKEEAVNAIEDYDG